MHFRAAPSVKPISFLSGFWHRYFHASRSSCPARSLYNGHVDKDCSASDDNGRTLYCRGRAPLFDVSGRDAGLTLWSFFVKLLTSAFTALGSERDCTYYNAQIDMGRSREEGKKGAAFQDIFLLSGFHQSEERSPPWGSTQPFMAYPFCCGWEIW